MPNKIYHFVATSEMLNKIYKFQKQIKLNFSKSIRLILDTMMPVLEYYIIFEEESACFGYNKFGSETDIRFYINSHMYRKLKNIQGSMHTFSIAVIVRKLIELFFLIIEKKGLDWLTEKMKKGIKKIINFLSKTKIFSKPQKKMIHMYGDDMMMEYITMIYSKNYTLLGVELSKKQLLFKNRYGLLINKPEIIAN